MGNFEKLCYDKGEVDKYKYILMLNKLEEELKSFYPGDEIVKDYGEALIKYKSDAFIYPFTHEEGKEMIHNTRIQLAYDEGVEQNKLEVIKNMINTKCKIKDIAVALGINEEEVSNIVFKNNLDK